MSTKEAENTIETREGTQGTHFSSSFEIHVQEVQYHTVFRQQQGICKSRLISHPRFFCFLRWIFEPLKVALLDQQTYYQVFTIKTRYQKQQAEL